MPTAHIAQWKHNREFLGRIDPEFPDWAITVIFYVAVHAIDALLKHDRVEVISHETRNRALRETNRYSHIWRHYQPLYSLSRTIRYFANPTTWVPWDQIETKVIGGYLKPIEASVRKLTNEAFPDLPIVMKSIPKPA